MADHFTHARLDKQSRAWLRDAKGDLWMVCFNPNFGPEVTCAERGVPESHMKKDDEVEQLKAALKALDDCYCETSDDMSRAQRDHHRKVLTEARNLLQPQT